MSNNSDIDRYVQDPSLLIELCRTVIDQLEAGAVDAEASEKETQLREISRTIDRLEKAGVPVPDVLRGEKTRLMASLSVETQAAQALNQLADKLEELVKDLAARLGRTGAPTGRKKRRPKHARAPRTNDATLREHIIQALKKLGGRARVADVMAQIEKQLDGKLLPGDLEWRDTTREPAWQNNVKWERSSMAKDGILRGDSPRGIWELSEDYQ